jgi:hypothetical protein
MESTVEQSPEYQAARRQVQRLRGFYAHLAVYLAVNAGLLVINLFTAPERLWVMGPLAGWGIGVVIHGAAVFLRGRFFGNEWEDRKVRELLQRQQQSRS